MLNIFPKKCLHTNVTFIGLGNMGYFMAKNLIKGGTKVFGYDLRAATVEKFQAEGGMKFASLENSIKQSSAIITILPNYKIVRNVWDMVINNAQKGTFLIDCSTISPFDAMELAKIAKQSGVVPVDAPVTGAQMGAVAGTLNFLIGSEHRYFPTIKNILQPMGKNFFIVVEIPQGRLLKYAITFALVIYLEL